MPFGLDCLGLARWGSGAIRAIPRGYAIGVFSRTFGDAMPAVRSVVSAGKCTALRVQLIWSDSHSFSDHDIATVKAEAKRWGDFARQHPGLPVYLSPFCEHNLSNPDKYLQIVKDEAPNCEPVNTPWQGRHSGKFINEVHGTEASAPGGRYIFSYDGHDMLESDITAMKRRHKNALLWFGWTANFNGITEVGGPKVPREERTAWPSEKLIQSIDYAIQHDKVGAALPTNWLWKSHAEDTGAGDPRSNKPVLISPVRAGAAELVAGSKVISRAPYYGPFVDGRSRYYFPEWGYELAQKQGAPVLDLRINGKVYGKVNPAFREGAYR